MAGRSEARIFASIWKDKAFRALPRSAQGMYMFLLSQPDLSYCGVIALRVPRWARHAEDLTVEEVRADLERLAKPFIEPFGDGSSGEAHQPFVVIDEESGELLVRSLIRNDGIWKQPNLLKAAREAGELVDSPRIRAALLDELERIPVDESSSHLVKTVLAEFMADLQEGCPKDPDDPSAKGSGNSSSDPSQGKGVGNGSSEQGPPSPSDPSPKPPAAAPPSASGADAPELFLVSDAGSKSKKRKASTKRKPDRTALDDEADGLTNGYWDRYSKTTAQSWIAVRQVVLGALRNEPEQRNDLAFALDALGRTGKPVTQNILTIALTEVREQRGLRPTGTGGHQPYQNPDDQSIYDEGM